MPPRQLPPDSERCEECTFDRWFHARCDRRAKHTVLAWTNQEHEGEARVVRLCGTHKLMADRGRSLSVYAGMDDRYVNRPKTLIYYPKKSEVNSLKDRIESTEREASWRQGDLNRAKTTVGRAMFEQAPEILEMLFMVAERGDQRALAAIKTIQDGMSEVEKADAEYQALVDKIEALKAKIEQAKGEQA